MIFLGHNSDLNFSLLKTLQWLPICSKVKLFHVSPRATIHRSIDGIWTLRNGNFLNMLFNAASPTPGLMPSKCKNLTHIWINGLDGRVFILVLSAGNALLSSFRALVQCCLVNEALRLPHLKCFVNSTPSPPPFSSQHSQVAHCAFYLSALCLSFLSPVRRMFIWLTAESSVSRAAPCTCRC